MTPRKLAPPTEGRKASVPLYVMLEPEQMDRYKQMAEDLGISMREVVVMAMEDLWARRPAGPPTAVDPNEQLAQEQIAEFEHWMASGAGKSTMGRAVVSQSSRLAELEERVKKIEQYQAIEAAYHATIDQPRTRPRKRRG